MIEKTNPLTNVTSLLSGNGVSRHLCGDLKSFIVTTMPIPWDLAKQRIGGAPAKIVFVDSMEQDRVEQQLEELPEFDCVVAIGGGQAIDLGKYFSWKRQARLITIPTVISVDAFVTSAAAIRINRKIEYIGNSSPNPLVIDYDLIRTAPNHLNIAGVGDLLSIHTAVYDWTLAAKNDQNQYQFHQKTVDQAYKILNSIIDRAEDIRNLTNQGIDAIINGYMDVNRVCLPLDHYRIEEGSEHYLFYELEARTGKAYVHGQIIGLGIYIMSHLQKNKHEIITNVMDRMGLKYQPKNMGIKLQTLIESLENLRKYVCEREDLWYTVIDKETITPEWIDYITKKLEF